MAKNTLDVDGQARLKKVLAFTGNNLELVSKGIVEALKGVSEKGRRTYLWNQLRKRAERIIKAHLKKAAQAHEKPFRSRHEMYLDAYRHELRIASSLPEEDR
jgi:Na+/phosphate symporter